MNWLFIFALILLVAVVAFLADCWAKKTPASKKLRRHANTGEFKVIKHDLSHELSYNTAEIPMPRTAVQPQVQAGLDYIERRYGRTDTVMASAIDPKDYPEWAR